MIYSYFKHQWKVDGRAVQVMTNAGFYPKDDSEIEIVNVKEMKNPTRKVFYIRPFGSDPEH